MLVAVDFWAESMILEHSGYGFYYCAAAFWTVFLVYHHLPLKRESKVEKEPDAKDDLTA